MSRYLYILIVLLAGTANATNYFVKVGGNNASAGTSWATAWEHPNKVNGSVAYGDVVYFAPGQYDTVSILPTVGGVTYRSAKVHSDADSGVSATRLSSGALLSGDFTLRSGSVYRYDATITPRWNTWVADGRMAVTEDDSVLMSCTSLAAVNSAGKYFYDASTDSLFVWSFGSDDPDGHVLRYSQRPVVVFNTSINNVTFYGLTLDMGYQATMILSHSDGTSNAPDSINIIHCNVQNTSGYGGGVNPALIYSGNPAGATPSSESNWSQYNHITGCTLRYSVANSSDYSGGAAFDWYAVQRTTADSNYIYGCYGGPIMLKFGSSGSAKALDNIFAFNRCKGGRASVWVSGRQDGTWFYGNEFIGATTYALDIHSTSANGSYKGIKFYNNTFANGGSSYSLLFSPEAEGACEFKYNIVSDSISTIARTMWWKVQGGEAPEQHPLTCTYWTIDSNMYWFGSSSFQVEFSFTSGDSACSGSGTNFAAWQSAGFDVHGSATTNPGFASSGTYNHSRPSASGEMNRSYGGRTWTIYGAVQNEAACADTLVAPVFQSPANGATGQANSVILDWSDSTQVGTVDLYDLQVDNNSDFSSVTFSSSTAWSKDTVTATLALYTTYYWRIRGRSDCDTSAWSGYRSFTMQDSCIVISSLPYTASTADTCYCLQDRRMASTGTGITATGRNVRILNRYGTRDTLEFGTDGGDNYRGVKATADNFKIDGLYVWHNPSGVNDSAKNNICVYIENVDTAKIWRTQVRPAGLNGRGLQNNSGGFDIDVWRLKHDSTAVRSFESRCQHLGNVMLFDPEPEHDDGNYFVKVHACSVTNAPHNIVAFTGGPTYHPLIYCDSNYFVPDARNDWYSYPDGQSNACYSSGDPFAIDVLGMGPGSRIRNNYLGYGTLNEGGQGMLLQNLMGSSGDSIVISGNYTVSSSGPNDIHGSGLCASQYFRYVPGDANTGSQYVAIRDNYWETILDTDTSTTYRGRQGETWSLILSGGAPSSTNEADSFRHIDWTRNVVKLTVTGTRAGFLEGSAISWGARDSSTSPYNRNGYLASKYNHYSSPYCVVEIGNMRGTPGNGLLSIGDTIDQTIDDDSTYSFDRTSSYTSHSRHNRIINAIYSGYANDADIGFDTGGNTDNDTLGESISFWKTLTSVVTTCTDNTVVSGASYWVWDSYGDTVLTGTTSGDGVITGLVNYKCETYDKFPADGFVLADSAYNDFTIKAKKNDDSVQVTITVAAASLTQSDSLCFLTLAAGEESPMIMMRGISIRGVTIK